MNWNTHPVFRDYAVSDTGQVKRITAKKGAKVGRILKAAVTPAGYEVVCVSGKMKFVHVLVLETFVGPRTDGAEARHRNDIKRDNRVANLCWGTHAENYADRVLNGGGNHGERHGLSKLSDAQAAEVRELYLRGGLLQRDIAARFGVSRECVSTITRGARRAAP